MNDLQRTDQWFKDRLGKLTASRINEATAKNKKGEYYPTREKYMIELIGERFTGEPAPHYTSWAMQWGIDHEEEGLEAYSTAYGYSVAPMGFVQHPFILGTGASPDGLVGELGGCELKCPETSKHLYTIETGGIQEAYIDQSTWGMLCTGRSWWDFVSYDPRLKSSLSLFVKRIELDKERAAYLEEEAVKFLSDMDKKIDRILSRYPSVAKSYNAQWKNK